MAARHLKKVRDLLPKNTGEGGTECGRGVYKVEVRWVRQETLSPSG